MSVELILGVCFLREFDTQKQIEMDGRKHTFEYIRKALFAGFILQKLLTTDKFMQTSTENIELVKKFNAFEMFNAVFSGFFIEIFIDIETNI